MGSAGAKLFDEYYERLSSGSDGLYLEDLVYEVRPSLLDCELVLGGLELLHVEYRDFMGIRDGDVYRDGVTREGLSKDLIGRYMETVLGRLFSEWYSRSIVVDHSLSHVLRVSGYRSEQLENHAWLVWEYIRDNDLDEVVSRELLRVLDEVDDLLASDTHKVLVMDADVADMTKRIVEAYESVYKLNHYKDVHEYLEYWVEGFDITLYEEFSDLVDHLKEHDELMRDVMTRMYVWSSVAGFDMCKFEE